MSNDSTGGRGWRCNIQDQPNIRNRKMNRGIQIKLKHTTTLVADLAATVMLGAATAAAAETVVTVDNLLGLAANDLRAARGAGAGAATGATTGAGAAAGTLAAFDLASSFSFSPLKL
jgi:hypothetical protein